MSYISNRVQNTFVKIFKNLAKELLTMPESLLIGIEYNSDGAVYTVYKDLNKLKQEVPDGNGGTITIDKKIDIQAYTGAMISVGGGAIQATIEQFGAQQANDLGCKTTDIDMILKYNGENDFPKACLRKRGEGDKMIKVKNIDIMQDVIPQ